MSSSCSATMSERQRCQLSRGHTEKTMTSVLYDARPHATDAPATGQNMPGCSSMPDARFIPNIAALRRRSGQDLTRE